MTPNDSSSIGKVQTGDIFEAFRELDDPVLSTTEIDQYLHFASRSTIYRKLMEMEEDGLLRTKKAGEGKRAGRVWYPPDDISEVPAPTPELKRFVYLNPSVSAVIGGFISLGIAFVFFIPSYFGDGPIVELLGHEFLAAVSIVAAVIGLILVYLGGGLIIGRVVVNYLRRS